MKIFLATAVTRAHLAALTRAGSPRWLLSFANLRAPGIRRKLDAATSVAEALGVPAPPESLEVLLDSGAFAVWNRGATVTLDEYSGFLVQYSKLFARIVSLDVIPGQRGVPPTTAEIERSAAEGWENFNELKRRLGPAEGAKVIQVYHRKEHMRWLTKLLNEGGDYIGISPGVDRAPHRRDDWLESLRPHLTDERGRPLRRVHGFAITAPELLERHSWLYSVDSTSWVKVSRYGSCYLPFRDTQGCVRHRIIPFSSDHSEAQP